MEGRGGGGLWGRALDLAFLVERGDGMGVLLFRVGLNYPYIHRGRWGEGKRIHDGHLVGHDPQRLYDVKLNRLNHGSDRKAGQFSPLRCLG